MTKTGSPDFRIKTTRSGKVLQLVESHRNPEGKPRQRIDEAWSEDSDLLGCYVLRTNHDELDGDRLGS